MGQVYLARDSRLHRKVALKSLSPLRTDDRDARARILGEARAAARINHPNVAAVYDVLEDEARAFGLDVLVECHDRDQLERALRLRTRLIGINNRDLRDFRTSLDMTLGLLPSIPGDRLVVAESGISSPGDVSRLAQAGVSAYLVGSAFMAADDPGKELSRLFSGR